LTAKDLFAEECRQTTGYTDPEDYYHEEYESAVDHMEIESQSDFAWKFFVAGMEAQRKLNDAEKSSSPK
jgi:hypothetical protein